MCVAGTVVINVSLIGQLHYVATHSLTYVLCVIQDPPSINDVTVSTSRTPSDLSGFDIFIMWTVSGLAT